ncbi:hypothetical protein Sa4125_39140 [Aureimonas sp. SA4125]|uniref:AAA family ATPase n=1 Tax=Aureimonas sp. SA4125 TaxID=2826993 RepID=UPI001CC5FCB1|nr:AAA family ATPase [Aureimonas sp. SA4125]BDA86372.1 hypothetical protein Sa4125_39140 [Aureimonas sp. SA4125]
MENIASEAPSGQVFGDVLGDRSRPPADEAATAKSSQVLEVSRTVLDGAGDCASPANAFRQFWDLGYKSIIPIVPPGAPLYENSVLQRSVDAGKDPRGKAPGIRGSDGRWMGLKNWQTRETTEADLDPWFASGAGVGLVDDGGLCLLDIDATDEATANAIERDALEAFGPAPLRVGSWPKRALVYQVDEPLLFTSVTFEGPDGENRIEVLAQQKQMVVQGIHPKTGKPYEWRRPIVPRDKLTLVTHDQVDAFLDRQRAKLPAATRSTGSLPVDRSNLDQEALKGDIELIRQAVVTIPNSSELFPRRDDMVRFGLALRAACADDLESGREIFHGWASRWERGDYDYDKADQVWNSLKPPHSIGARWLFKNARKHGGDEGAAVYDSYIGTKLFEKLKDGETDTPTPTAALDPTGKKRFSFDDFADLAAVAMQSSAKPLIKGLLDQGAMSILYGESNTGKTFVAMDLAYHVASGRPWADMHSAGMMVVYVAAEGGRGVSKRIAALQRKFPNDAAPPFKVLRSSVDLLRGDTDLMPLIASIRELGVDVGMIVIDTLSRAMAGGDENASTDMGAMVRHLDKLRAATGAHLMAVHHSGKDRAKGARGHSLLRAATDTEIEITAGDDARGEIRVTKQRDLDRSFSTGFALEPAMLGFDDDGNIVTSRTVRLLPKMAATEPNGEPSPEEIERRRRIAHAVLRALGGADSAKINAVLPRLVTEMKAAGVKVGATLPTIRTLLLGALCEPGVEIDADGQTFILTVAKSDHGEKAPWIITALKVPRFDKDNLSEGYESDERQGVFS